jgi:hypothetical protein
VKYPQIVAAAAAKGIVVNAIQCGDVTETVAPWQHIASLGHGRYFTVEQAGSAVAIATPFDAEIATLSAALDGTRLYYGSVDERAEMASKVEATTRLNEEASVTALARRGVFNASEAGASNFLGGRELVDDVVSGRVDVATLPSAELPASIVALPPEEQRAVIAETAQKREELQRQIAKLGADRDAYLDKEVDAAGGAAASLDQQIYDAVREQAAPLGLSYEDGPKF